jgi:5'-nucleotidase
MRNVNDKRYSHNALGVDLILGGHDHIYWIEQRWDNLVMKSGSDYRCLSEIKIEKQDDVKYEMKTKKSNGEVTDETVETDKEYVY